MSFILREVYDLSMLYSLQWCCCRYTVTVSDQVHEHNTKLKSRYGHESGFINILCCITFNQRILILASTTDIRILFNTTGRLIGNGDIQHPAIY